MPKLMEILDLNQYSNDNDDKREIDKEMSVIFLLYAKVFQ